MRYRLEILGSAAAAISMAADCTTTESVIRPNPDSPVAATQEVFFGECRRVFEYKMEDNPFSSQRGRLTDQDIKDSDIAEKVVPTGLCVLSGYVYSGIGGVNELWSNISENLKRKDQASIKKDAVRSIVTFDVGDTSGRRSRITVVIGTNDSVLAVL